MKIILNNKETDVDEGGTVATLAKTIGIPMEGLTRGVAIAVNNQMIPRAFWEEQKLSEGDNVVVIRAACGG